MFHARLRNRLHFFILLWPSYLMDSSNLRPVGEVGAREKEKCKRPYLQRVLIMTEIWLSGGVAKWRSGGVARAGEWRSGEGDGADEGEGGGVSGIPSQILAQIFSMHSISWIFPAFHNHLVELF